MHPQLSGEHGVDQFEGAGVMLSAGERKTLRLVARYADSDAGDVADARDAAVGAGLDDDVLELLGLEQPTEGGHRQLEGVAGGDGRLADDAGGGLYVLGAKCPDDIAGGWMAAGEAGGIEPGPQGLPAEG